MSINIDLGAWNSIFAVPSKVVDEGLKFSDGVKLKVLLFVLRNAGRSVDDTEISKATGVNVTDIPEALDYWVSIGVFNRIENTFTPVKNNEEFVSAPQTPVQTEQTPQPVQTVLQPQQTVPQPVQAVQEPVKQETEQSPKENAEEPQKHFTATRPQKPDFVFTAQRLAVDEELKMLVEETQTTLGKVLSNSDIATLLMLKDTCGLPLDVIFMLIHYCASIDKGNIRTIENIGIQWANDGVYSLEAADNKIKQIQKTTANFSIVSKAFGLKNVGSPTKKQLEYGDKWVSEWKFSPEMLREAYERCVDTKGTMNLRYIDGILKRWNASNLHTLDELHKYEKSASKPSQKQSSSYDINELDKFNSLDNFYLRGWYGIQQ